MANMTTPYLMADGRMGLDLDTNKTCTAADCGLVQNVIADAITITLPATAAGSSFIVRNGGVPATSAAAGTGSNGTALVSVAVAAGDGFTGGGFTAAINKKALNTKATSKVGDEIQVVGSGANTAAAWNFASVKGTWAREA
jgi:hypothetical protein